MRIALANTSTLPIIDNQTIAQAQITDNENNILILATPSHPERSFLSKVLYQLYRQLDQCYPFSSFD